MHDSKISPRSYDASLLHEPMQLEVSHSAYKHLQVIETDVTKQLFESLIDMLTIFSLQIEHPSLREAPNIAFRYLELANKMPSEKILELQNLIQKVHINFIANDVYERSNPKENVLITCPDGSVGTNKIILKLSYPYFVEKLKCSKPKVKGEKQKHEINFEDIESLEALKEFRNFTYAPKKMIDMKATLKKETLLQLYRLSKKISNKELEAQSVKALDNHIPSIIKTSEGLKFILDLDVKYTSMRWKALKEYLIKNNVSFMSSAKEEIALNVVASTLLEGEGDLSKLMQMYTTGLYVERVIDLEKLYMCFFLKNEVRDNIRTLIFPESRTYEEYSILAKKFININNIIVRVKNGLYNKSQPSCFTNLKLFTWIKEKKIGKEAHSSFIAEVNYCKNAWVEASSIKQLKDEISESRYNESLSWKVEKEGNVTDLFFEIQQHKHVSLIY